MKTNHQHITNEQLVEQFQNGRVDALKLLIKRFHPKLVRTISYQIRSCDPVDDIAQECWYVIIEKLETVQLKISFQAWALTITRRKAIDWIREQQRTCRQDREIQAELKSNHANSPTSEDRIDEVRMVVRQLPPTQQIVLNMFYRENLSLKEISKVLDIAEGTVKSRLFHAREKLKDIINP